jgi:hypothetical protein
MSRRTRAVLAATSLFLGLTLTPVVAPAISAQEKLAKAKATKPKSEEVDEAAAQRRTVAISLVTSLADEAKSFKDQTRRARIQARAADVLWDTDQDRARELFHRAWDAAEVADNETAKKQAEEMKKMESGPVALRNGPDLRSEVLRLVAKRDRKLGEEFLKALDEANQKAREDADAQKRLDPTGADPGAAKRLQLARRLIDDGQIERAMEFAAPALNSINRDSIFFLSVLREKNAQQADNAFANLLARGASDPLSDANTISGLSSYLFTPFLYVTFDSQGGANDMRMRGPTPPPAVAPELRNNFLKVAYQILMQPLPAPDQDHSTSGRTGKYLVIKRLLPVFDQYAADLSPALRTQMTALTSFVPDDLQRGENAAVNRGILPEETVTDPTQHMQERLDRAKTSGERDDIYADYAVSLTEKGDPLAKELVNKIEDSELRKNVKAYTDFEWTQIAVRNKDAAEIARLAKNGELTSIQKVWAYTNAAKLLVATERSHAVELLDEALNESRRISGSDPDRARSLTAVAVGLAELDQVRAWETLAEVVKAANSAEGFTGEDTRMTSMLRTKGMVVMGSGTAPEFDLLMAFRALARADVMRAIQLAKGFTGEAPRAVATLAIARSILEKPGEPLAASAN